MHLLLPLRKAAATPAEVSGVARASPFRGDRPARLIDQPAVGRPSRRSIGVGADDFAAAPGPQGPPGRVADRTLDELHGAVAEEHVGTTGMGAAGAVAHAVVGELAGGTAGAAAAVSVL